jgi:hypothetical protein
MCPFLRAENRLQDCEHYWNKAAEAYQQPRDFTRELQTTIQQLRTVTFVLQDSKRKIPGFEAWYGRWQESMSQDSVLLWLKGMRNMIEKQGDIEAASKLRLTFCNDWLSDETDEIEVPASYTAERAANMYAKLVKLPSEIGEEALIRFQREWRHPELKDYELLDALAHGYGFLLDLLLDGHELLDEKTRRECPFFSELTSSNVRLPEAMQARSCDSSVWYRLKDRTITSFQISQTSHLVKEGLEETKNRYEIDPSLLHQGDSLADTCRRWMQIGKQFLAKDGHIVPVFFIESETTAIPYAMQSRDRADKHAMVRLAADAVVAHRAHTVVHLGEVWTSRVDLT